MLLNISIYQYANEHIKIHQYLVICFVIVNVLDVGLIIKVLLRFQTLDFLKVYMKRCTSDKIKVMELNCLSNGWQLRVLMMEYSQKRLMW